MKEYFGLEQINTIESKYIEFYHRDDIKKEIFHKYQKVAGIQIGLNLKRCETRRKIGGFYST